MGAHPGPLQRFLGGRGGSIPSLDHEISRGCPWCAVPVKEVKTSSDQRMLPLARTIQNKHSIANKFRAYEVSIDRWHFISRTGAKHRDTRNLKSAVGHEISPASGLWSLTSPSEKNRLFIPRKKKRGHQFPPCRLWAAYNISIAHGDAACQCLLRGQYHTGTTD